MAKNSTEKRMSQGSEAPVLHDEDWLKIDDIDIVRPSISQIFNGVETGS
ncbi:hypothetical protein [Salicibibacter kimchii]|nr:hypothetical protein [Salicibibacter kimchii]